MIEDLSLVLNLQRQEPMGAHMDNLEGNHYPTYILEGGIEDDSEDGEEENPFYTTELANWGPQRRLEDQLQQALDLNSGGIKIEVANSFGKMHAEGYLDWEASLENYFEWKQMAETRKVLFVKLKL